MKRLQNTVPDSGWTRERASESSDSWRRRRIGSSEASLGGPGESPPPGSPAANNVNQLVQTVVLNYMALHGEQGSFASLFPNHGLGNASLIDSLTAFAPIR